MLNILATCWNINCCTRWILIQLLLINNYTFWREVEMADEEMLLSLCALSVVAVIMKRRQKDEKKRKNMDARIRSILHPVGRTQKLWHFKLQKFLAYQISRPSRSFSSWWPQLSRSRRSTIPLGEYPARQRFLALSSHREERARNLCLARYLEKGSP